MTVIEDNIVEHNVIEDNDDDEQSLSIEEDRPLLDEEAGSSQIHVVKGPSTAKENHKNRVIYLCFVLIVLVEIGTYLQILPINMIMEDIICRDFFPESLPLNGSSSVNASASRSIRDDPRCKSVPVQSELATLRGWGAMFDQIPSILTSIPYGFAADKYGRIPILGLAFIGIIIQCVSFNGVLWFSDYFPIRLTWLTSIFSLIGGGGMVITSLLFTIISDVASEAERTTIFFRMGASLLVGELIGSPLASSIMNINPWFSIILGIGCVIACTLIIAAIPETLGSRVTAPPPADLVSDEEDAIREPGPVGALEHWGTKAKSSILHVGAATRFIFKDTRILLLLFTFIVATLGRYAQEILMQYVTKRYNWTWSQAGFLLSLRAFANITLLLVILPGCSYLLLHKRAYTPKHKDLALARGSIIALTIGTFVIGSAPVAPIMVIGLSIWATGVGFPLLVRSVVTSIVEPHHMGTLYNSIAVLEAIGSMAAGPALSMTFKKGLELGGGWIGLPYFVISALLACAMMSVWLVRLDKGGSAMYEDVRLD